MLAVKQVLLSCLISYNKHPIHLKYNLKTVILIKFVIHFSCLIFYFWDYTRVYDMKYVIVILLLV